jgi:hypothetical protein
MPKITVVAFLESTAGLATIDLFASPNGTIIRRLPFNKSRRNISAADQNEYERESCTIFPKLAGVHAGGRLSLIARSRILLTGSSRDNWQLGHLTGWHEDS